MIITAYMTRALQLLTKSTKKAEVERAEELGEDRDEIPIAETPLEDESRLTSAAGSTVALLNLSAPPRAQEPVSIAGRQSDPPSRDEEQSPDPGLMMRRQVPPPPARCRIWAAHISNRIDILTYALILLFVGIPVFFGAGYSMPLHLCVNVLAYFGASAIPHSWRRFLHPVIVSAFATAVTIYVFGLMRGQGLPETLHEYRTGLKYLQLWEGARADGGEKPGAGDMLGTVLDASIVALALPMFQYRRELKEHFLAIVVPNVLLSVGTLFSQPYICYVLGISPQRSLAFAARSLTLALAIPAVENLKGDHDTIAAVAIMSGVVGALVGQKMLDWLKIPDDDYVTRGVTLGANSSAVATALLLRTDPRAAALSSLSMSLFGAITVLFTSIPPMTAVIRSLVGL
ncbi:uncharacterized protein E0L32_010199 [Thyridium curvatum]|uniref:Plastidal glycolate/glycerate translocator 1 n=1 Tax=Thyridium curvatum TaxID=1093900 RepID=A0A507AGV4_9PEZI|nr:uncharacterized protein E0L32_010199 [Thyridium curvatum]TPX08132.1 hypothetical protein E0L32_010199 [Thyridium curvatum]